jgi:tetratricopeptide repeat protein
MAKPDRGRLKEPHRLGLDHPTTLRAATALTVALVQLGEAEQARTLGEDTLRRSRRVLGPDHPITQYLTQAARSGQLLPDDDAAEDHPSRPL